MYKHILLLKHACGSFKSPRVAVDYIKYAKEKKKKKLPYDVPPIIACVKAALPLDLVFTGGKL